MSTSPSLAVKLFGTEHAVEPMRTLRAGPLSAEFDQGALRFIKIYGVEAIRNIAFVVRDKDWGTYNPTISNLRIDQQADSFSVSFDAVCKDENQGLHFSASIAGSADGSLRFEGRGKAISDFLTNRTGFVVLHPVAGVSGFPVEIEHVDGSKEQTEFPELVDPIQPFKDIRAMTHNVLPGVKVCCRMEGDTFETEDHRQWNDASYKTYVRPIGLPWPFTIPAGELTEQAVTLTVNGAPTAAPAGDAKPAVVQVELSDAGGQLPRIGVGLEPQHAESALATKELLKQLGPQLIVCWHDLRAGHGATDLQQAKALASAVDAELVLEAVLPCEDYQKEIAAVVAQAKQAGVRFAAVSFTPAEYLKSIMPGTSWPDVPELADIYDHVRQAFPEVALGGGMHAFFPELNRHRPPTDPIDYITHTSNMITHACDDITVTENLEALPYVIKTCRSFAADKPYRVGPSAIGMRFNPYGSKTMDNPDNNRVAMARLEPRQRGLINAAWTLGYLAHMIRGGIDVVSLQAPTGEFGLIYQKMPWSQLWFDDASAEVYPAYHVVAGFAAASAANAERLTATSSNSHDVECAAYRQNGVTTIWLANLCGDQRSVELSGLPAGDAQFYRLDADTFEACTMRVDAFTASARLLDGTNSLSLAPYAVVRVDID